MKREAMLALLVAAGTMCGLAGCDPSSQTALPDPNVDGVTASRPVDTTIMDDQAKLYQERKTALERAVAPPPVAPAATAAATDAAAPGTPAATTTAPAENTAPPTPDATTPPPTDPPR